MATSGNLKDDGSPNIKGIFFLPSGNETALTFCLPHSAKAIPPLSGQAGVWPRMGRPGPGGVWESGQGVRGGWGVRGADGPRGLRGLRGPRGCSSLAAGPRRSLPPAGACHPSLPPCLRPPGSTHSISYRLYLEIRGEKGWETSG